jgi:YfiR/HmsC-like
VAILTNSRLPERFEISLRLQLALVMAIAATGLAKGQIVDEYQMKAAFLYNFAKFVDWPPQKLNRLNDPVVICVLGEDPFGKLLDDTVQGKTIEGHPLQLGRIADTSQAAGCHVVFVSISERRRLNAILTDLSSAGVLTVGETEGFAVLGGIINFKLENERRIRFEVNLNAAREANLKLSSKLLSLALIVRK